jgi:hypothetical protein
MLRRALVLLGGLLALLTIVTIVIHIPAIQRRVGACPFGYDKPRTAAATARARATGPLAPARPALGFTLAATTRADVLAWAAQHDVRCERRLGDRALECAGAKLLAHGASLATTTTWFELDEHGTVTTIKTVRRATSAAAVASAFAATESLLRSRLDTPSTERGSTAELSLGAFRQAMVEHVYADYRAQVRATNMGNGGYILTESYAAL